LETEGEIGELIDLPWLRKICCEKKRGAISDVRREFEREN
jgi:hypothetical protein